MKTFVRSLTAGVFLLLLGLSTSNAQEVTFSAGPTITPGSGAANGGFAWGDVNGDGNLDVFIPSNNIMLNSITTFAPAASTMTAKIPFNANGIGGLLADFNGDGVLDLFSTNGGSPSGGLLYDSAGVFIPATGTGDLATAGVTGEVFQGAAAAPIDHSNYLSVCWPGTFTNIASNNPASPAGAMWLLKGGSNGFTDIAKGAAAGNLGIDTSLSYESWDVRFFDANNDGYLDLLMPSFRNGISKVDTGSSGARKGCVLFLNDKTGKFYVPTAATLGRTIYSLGAGGVVSTTADTGIVVDDTVRHLAAIGEQWGDLNNDGIEDLILNGLNANDNPDGTGNYVADVILYGKGDGTFTYKWDKVHLVASNGLVQNTAQRAIDIGDYNNDGLPDILTSQTFTPQHLYKNNGDGTFTDVATTDGLTGGPGTQRAAQFVDYNNDGFLDVFLYTGGSAYLQKNGGNTNNWIAFKPIGSGHNMSAIGAKFTVWNGGKQQVRVIKAEGGSAGEGGELRANFGLGTTAKTDSVAVQWPDGTNQTFVLKGGVNRYYTIKEGEVVPALPALLSPASGVTNQPGTLKLTWTKAAGALGYQLQVSTDPTFADRTKLAINDSTKLNAPNDTSETVNVGLATSFFWRVLAYNTYLTSAYTSGYQFTTFMSAPALIPKLLSPALNAMNQSAVIKLVCSKTADASTYHWQVSTSLQFPTEGGLAVDDTTTDTTNVVGPLRSGTQYYWRVQGINPLGLSKFPDPAWFVVMTAPVTPALAYPANNAQYVRADTLVLSWTPVAADTGYLCQISTSPSFSSLVGANDTTRTASFMATSLQNLTKYFWRVAAYNPGGTSAFSATDSFTTVVAIPATPTLVSPRSTTGVGRPPTFVWNSAVRAEKYELQVATDNAFSAIVKDVTIPDTTIQISDTLKASTVYYWRVSAIDTGGPSPYSAVAHFTTGVTGVQELGGVPKAFALFQNYPNPFNPSTVIRYDVPKSAFVTVTIYDALGRVVANLVNEMQSPNRYSVEWNPSGLSSGIYFCRVQAQSQDGSGNFTSVKKLLYMK